MNLENIHLIQGDENDHILFYPPTYSLLSINDAVFNYFSEIKNGMDITSVAQKLKTDKEKIEKLIDEISDLIKKDRIKSKPNSLPENKIVSRINLHISNDCNLRCTYCYAPGGNYNMNRELLTEETADDFITFCINNFDKVKRIVFFGGEPLLNYKMIEYVCLRFKHLKEKNIIDYIPVFAIITNGTLMNNPILGVLKEHIEYITVSIDGPKEINDINRIFPNQKGSYEKIAYFIKTIKNETNIPIRYESTFTQDHLDMGYQKSDIEIFLRNEFSIEGTVVEDININTNYDKSFISENIDTRKMELVNDFPEGFFGILSSIVNGWNKIMCPVGSDMISISTQGYIYPCAMNTGNDKVVLGHINDENVFNNRKKYEVQFPYLRSIWKVEDTVCHACWAKNICGGCTMKWFYNKESDKYNSHPHESKCTENKKYIENVLRKIVHIRKDEILWDRLNNFVKNNAVSL